MVAHVVERLASAAVSAGLESGWALELARNVAACCFDGVEPVFETALELLSHRVRNPGAGRPREFHALLSGVDVERVARAMASAWLMEAA